MLKTPITYIFILGSLLAIFCEFSLSYPTVMYDDITSFVSETSFLLPFMQILTFMSGLYVIYSAQQVNKSIPVSTTIDENKNLGTISLEEFELEKLNDEKIINNLNTKISNASDRKNKFENALWAICNEFKLSQGLLYSLDHEILNIEATFAFIGDKNTIDKIEVGVGITGQSAKNKEMIYIQDVPKGYLKVVSGLGEAYPEHILIIPIKKENDLLGMVELCGMGKLSKQQIDTINQITNSIFTKLLTK